MTLTSNGALFAKSVRDILNRTELATLSMRSVSTMGQHLDVLVSPTFGNRWLIPKLSGFYENHPEVMLNVHTRVGTPDFAELQNKPQSCAIAFCEQAPTGCLSDVILRLKLVAVVAPKLLTDIELQRLDLHGETILCSHPLLNQSSLPTAWHDWLLSANLKTGAVSFGAEFALMSLVHQAALVGMGIALLPHYLIKDNLARGELVQLLPNRYEPRSSYQLIYTEENLKNPFFSAFQQWLFSQAAER